MWSTESLVIAFNSSTKWRCEKVFQIVRPSVSRRFADRTAGFAVLKGAYGPRRGCLVSGFLESQGEGALPHF